MDFNELDLIGQQEDLQRRKAIVDALIMQQSMPGQSLRDLTGTWFGRNLPADAQRQIEAYRADSQAYRQREQQQLGTELNDFTSRMNGAPARAPVSLGLNEQTGQPAPAYGPTLPAQAPNPREAVVRAMTSQLPEMQAMGKAAMSSLMKPRDMKEHVIGDTLVTTDGQGNLVNSKQFNKADWSEVKQVGVDGDGKPLYGQTNSRTGEIKYTPHPLVNIDQKGQTEVQKAAVEAAKNSRAQVMTGQTTVDSASRILEALDDPQVRNGFGASVANGLAAVGAKLGFNEGDSVAKTQTLASELAKGVLNSGQDMKGSFSDKDIEFLNQVSLGKIDFNPQALGYLASLLYAAGHNAIMSGTDQWRGSTSIKGLEGLRDVYPMPEVRYNAKISDRPGFSMSSNGRLSFIPQAATPSPSSAAVPSRGRQRISVQDFLGGQ